MDARHIMINNTFILIKNPPQSETFLVIESLGDDDTSCCAGLVSHWGGLGQQRSTKTSGNRCGVPSNMYCDCSCFVAYVYRKMCILYCLSNGIDFPIRITQCHPVACGEGGIWVSSHATNKLPYHTCNLIIFVGNVALVTDKINWSQIGESISNQYRVRSICLQVWYFTNNNLVIVPYEGSISHCQPVGNFTPWTQINVCTEAY